MQGVSLTSAQLARGSPHVQPTHAVHTTCRYTTYRSLNSDQCFLTTLPFAQKSHPQNVQMSTQRPTSTLCHTQIQNDGTHWKLSLRASLLSDSSRCSSQPRTRSVGSAYCKLQRRKHASVQVSGVRVGLAWGGEEERGHACGRTTFGYRFSARQ